MEVSLRRTGLLINFIFIYCLRVFELFFYLLAIKFTISVRLFDVSDAIVHVLIISEIAHILFLFIGPATTSIRGLYG